MLRESFSQHIKDNVEKALKIGYFENYQTL